MRLGERRKKKKNFKKEQKSVLKHTRDASNWYSNDSAEHCEGCCDGGWENQTLFLSFLNNCLETMKKIKK